LLLQHVTPEGAATQDPDQVSAMLTAIRDFAHDAFRTADGASVDTLRVGDLSVIVEQGPRAILAGVVRGTAPGALHETFLEALESVHRQLGTELQEYRGDPAPFARARPALEACLVSQFREKREGTAWRWWVTACALVFLALAIWAFISMRDRQRWNAYLEQLRSEPGIVVLSTGRRDGKFFVAGLRDPLAADPAMLAGQSNLSSDTVSTRWEAFDSLYPPFVAQRARRLLRPPPGVTLAYRDGVLTAGGPAPAAWIAESERLALALGGIRRFAYDGVAPERQLQDRIESISILFPKGQSRMLAGQDDTVRSLRIRLAELDEVLRARDEKAQVNILGHADADGTERENGPLSEARADRVLQLVSGQPLGRISFSTRGVGTTMPLTGGTSESDKQRNRRASFRVVFPDRSNESGGTR
jgi:outer membrane protein OmpA-like peptidoglycan-associated protein